MSTSRHPRTPDIPVNAFSPNDRVRHERVMRDIPRIAEIARKNIRQRSLRTDEIVAVWIVVDSIWKSIALELMPQYAAQWEREIASGIDPIAHGIVLPGICARVALLTPGIKAQINFVGVIPNSRRATCLQFDECICQLIYGDILKD